MAVHRPHNGYIYKPRLFSQFPKSFKATSLYMESFYVYCNCQPHRGFHNNNKNCLFPSGQYHNKICNFTSWELIMFIVWGWTTLGFCEARPCLINHLFKITLYLLISYIIHYFFHVADPLKLQHSTAHNICQPHAIDLLVLNSDYPVQIDLRYAPKKSKQRKSFSTEGRTTWNK